MPEMRTLYFKADNKPRQLVAIDANYALRNHGNEWSEKEWPKDEVEKYSKEYAAKIAKQDAEVAAKASQNKS